VADDTYTGSFYCVKCKEHRDATGKITVKNGTRMAKAQCSVCGTNLTRFLPKK
jgi:transcription elongation factor Elf1